MTKVFKEKGYIAVILGGSSGLGLAAAKKLAAAGMGLCLVHRSRREEMRALQADWEELQRQTEVFLEFNVDAGRPDAIREVLAALQPYGGRVRCLLYSVARGSLKAMEWQGLSRQDLQLTMEQMAFSLYDWVLGLSEAGCFAADARVLAFTSEGSMRARRHYGAVSAAKAALEALIRSMALEFAPRGIRANCIRAGVTDTPGMRRIPGSAEILEYSQRRNPFGRLTRAEDVAAVVCLLCTDEAAWINGSVIPVDGGEHIV